MTRKNFITREAQKTALTRATCLTCQAGKALKERQARKEGLAGYACIGRVAVLACKACNTAKGGNTSISGGDLGQKKSAGAGPALNRGRCDGLLEPIEGASTRTTSFGAHDIAREVALATIGAGSGE